MARFVLDINGRQRAVDATRSCLTSIATVAEKRIVTIEELGENGLHQVQEDLIDDRVPQCGYCQPGHSAAGETRV